MQHAAGAILALVLGVACNKGGGPAPSDQGEPGSPGATPAAGGAAVDTAAARDIFKSRCSACHGNEGFGDGPGAAALNPKPRNYHDKTWQAKVTDDDIKKTVVYGGAAVGKSPMMPASPDLDAKPEVVAGLVGIVRAFGK
jgi:mono/diheme cytochrome c family protein